MTIIDRTSMQRTAQHLAVEARRGYGSPPTYGGWQPVWAAKVDRIEINRGSKPSVATIWFPDLRWEQSRNLLWGDNIRIRTNELNANARTFVFAGFITGYLSDFSGGTERPSAFERNAVVCQDYRWLLSITSPIFGQRARGPDDYTDYGLPGQQAIDDSYVWLNGQRAVFNVNGYPNRDPVLLKIKTPDGDSCEIPIFFNPNDPNAVPWTARDMLCYVLNPFHNKAYEYFPISDPNKLVGIDHSDWDKVLNHIVIDGLDIIEAVQLICDHLGWSFRQDCDNDGAVKLVFYKIAAAAGYSRDDNNPTILHHLHAPAVGENISTAVAAGRKILWSMSLAEDISTVVNSPYGLGAPHRFEFTAELVPAWLDDNLEPDTSQDNDNLFFTEAQLQEITAPNLHSYYKYYHPRGSDFRRNVGRKWALNESGHYSKSDTYNRGMPFDFSTIIDSEYIKDSKGKRVFAPFNRRLLPCLTLDKDSLNTVGIRVEFSFDAGQNWQVIPASISSLADEYGVYITEANLAEMVDQAEGQISGGVLDDIQLNFWTSLCDDKLNSRSFKNGQWQTRVRITASVQMDRRISRRRAPDLPVAGSPFHHAQVYDFSEKYGLSKRTSSSSFEDGDLPVNEVDCTDYCDKHLEAIRQANQDMSISGQFTLERLWLGDGSGRPDFDIGDCIQKITGREYDLAAAFNSGSVYPEIIQLIYLPDKQKMKLITRDLRFAEVVL